MESLPITRLAEASLSRRAVLRRGGLAAAFAIAAGGGVLTPAEAHAQGVPLAILSAGQGTALAALGETMLPGARAAGIANFVDAQLGKATPLLIIRYFDWPGDLTAFYTQGLAALDRASETASGAPFAQATASQQQALAGALLGGKVPGWNGPPATLFYLATRSDAVDVVYGTVDGFAKLNIPYMPHILPAKNW